MKYFVKKWGLLLRWWMLFMLTSLGTVFLSLSGAMTFIYIIDFTRISFFIFILFYIFSIRNGILTYKIGKNPPLSEAEVTSYCQKTEVGWFVSDMLLTLGMIGTVLGFIFMLYVSFNGLAALNIAAIQAALMKMSTGMSTALVTTASGLICSLFLKIQMFDFSHYLDKLAIICGCKVGKNE